MISEAAIDSARSGNRPPARHAPEALSSDQLGALARDGDTDALGELLVRHRGLLRGQLRRADRYGHLDDLESALWLRLLRVCSTWRSGEGAWTTWASAVARNVGDCWRRSAHRRHEDLVEPRRLTGGVRVLERDELLDIELALPKLSAHQQQAIRLCGMQEFSSAEAAAIAGVPEPTLRNRLFYARRNLRAFMDAA